MYSDIEKQRLKQELKHKSRMDNLEYKQAKEDKKNNGSKLTYSKWIIIFLVSLLIIICAYAMVIMPLFDDLSALPVLISVIGAACIGAVIEYLWKSAKENTKGGIIRDTALFEIQNTDDEDGE